MIDTTTDTQAWLWQVGDLYQFPSGQVLCVAANATFAHFLTADGMTLSDLQVLDAPRSDYLLHRTRLRYPYQSRAQLLADYRAGVFTPYFNLHNIYDLRQMS